MNHPITRRFLILLAAVSIPACGGGGGGGGAVSATRPTAVLITPVGVQRSIVPVDFTLADAESSPVSITVQVSKDGGATFTTATPAFGNGSLAGLASSPSGSAHTFLWNSVDDAVATGTIAYGGPITTIGTVNTQVRIRIVPSDEAAGTPGTTPDFTVDNTYEGTSGVVSASFPHSFTALGNSETALGDLVADAMRVRYGVQLAFQNGWGIRTPLPTTFAPSNMALRRPLGGYAAGPPYDIVQADIFQMLPFGNRVITRTVTGSQLWAILELGVSFYPANNNGFPQISGFSFTFDQSNLAGSRVLSVTLAGGGAIPNDPAAFYTFATNDFINAGGDGYTMLNDGQGVAHEVLAQIVADHVLAAGILSPTIAGRITVVP